MAAVQQRSGVPGRLGVPGRQVPGSQVRVQGLGAEEEAGTGGQWIGLQVWVVRRRRFVSLVDGTDSSSASRGYSCASASTKAALPDPFSPISIVTPTGTSRPSASNGPMAGISGSQSGIGKHRLGRWLTTGADDAPSSDDQITLA